jgi:rhodanese-related sulfurtransferase
MDTPSLGILAALAAFFIYRGIQSSRVRRLIPDLLKQGATIIDVRSEAEFAQASNPASINIPLEKIAHPPASLRPEAPVIVCCASGMRSAMAKSTLQAMGFKRVVNAGAWTNTLVTLLFFILPLTGRAGAQWEKISEEEGISSFRREIDGSPIVAFRGEAMIDEGMPKIVGVLENVERAREWMADLAESYNIEKRSETDRFEYNRTRTPWPLQDRDFVIHTLTSFERKPEPVLTIRMVSEENPKKKVIQGVVRGELIDSRFILKSLGPKKTLFICEIQADPKGSIPKWVVNLFQKSWPLTTIQGLRKQILKKDIRENETLARALNAT